MKPYAEVSGKIGNWAEGLTVVSEKLGKSGSPLSPASGLGPEWWGYSGSEGSSASTKARRSLARTRRVRSTVTDRNVPVASSSYTFERLKLSCSATCGTR